MKKVRIGNDVRLQISLFDNSEFSKSNIKQLKCYLVNETLFDNLSKKCCGEYLLNVCGRPSYHVLPRCKSVEFLCSRDACKFDQVKCDNSKYLAESDIDYNNNLINIYFPAKDQICGVYKLIIVVESFVSGWGKTELKTNTIEYKDVLEITQDGEEQEGSVDIVAGINPDLYSGYVGFLGVQPFANEDQSDSVGFDRTDDSYEDDSQQDVSGAGAKDINVNDMLFVTNLSKFTSVVNYNDGYYLWIVSKKPITNIIDSNLNNIPFTSAQYDAETKLYYYACSNPMLKNNLTGGVSIKVKF